MRDDTHPLRGEPPAPTSEASVLQVVREAVGARATVRHWHVRSETYIVAAVETTSAERFIVKLEIPRLRPNRRFDVMATIARRVRAHTAVPIFDVIAVDVSRRNWPWNVLVVTELVGSTWAQLYPTLDDGQRATGQRQLGQAAAQLHTLTFDHFGEIDADGRIGDRVGPMPALSARADRRLRTSRYRDYFVEVLEKRASLFDAAPGPLLCHEDLNPNNLLFEVRHAQPVLTGVLDFESAWAGLPESDLARLELWRLTRGTALRDGYARSGHVCDGYAERRPILQLLWCLEYAENNLSLQHQIDTNGVCADLGVAPIQFG